MTFAITRAVSPRLADCELTYIHREPVDVDKACQQQKSYEQRLSDWGVKVISLPTEPLLPDCAFIQDTAIVTDECAIIARMGAPSRRQETGTVATVLAAHRKLQFIGPDATLEGGDVIRVGNRFYVGVSTRSDRRGFEQVRDLLKSYGYDVRAVLVTGCLHLTTGCSYLGRATMLVNRNWIDVSALNGMEMMDVSQGEDWAANTLLIGERLLHPSSFPKTTERLLARGFQVETIDFSELMKAEAGLSCLSIIF